MKPYFVFDCESIGLHGQTFAVGGGTYWADGRVEDEFLFSCPPGAANGNRIDREWVEKNCPKLLPANCDLPSDVAWAFWEKWVKAWSIGAVMAVDVGWPVESRFLASCLDSWPQKAKQAPYPILEISTLLTAAGMDPLENRDRLRSELPRHDPLKDARQSARLMFEAMKKLGL